MSWKTTIVLAVLAAATFGAWLVLQPEDETAVIRPRPFDWRESNFQSITIRIPERPDLVLRRQPEVALGSRWHLEKPAKPVDDALVQDMIAALNRLTREKSIKPGDAEYTPSVYGLDKPEVTVDVVGITEKRTIKFGNVSNRQPDARFFVLDPARVVGVELSRRILKAGQDIPKGGKPDYEKQKFVHRLQPTEGAKGWYIVEVNGEARNEKAEDVKVGHLISGLKEMKAD